LIVGSLIDNNLIVLIHNFVCLLFYAAKVLHQTAKTCQFVKKKMQKM